VEELISYVRNAAKLAPEHKGNTFYVYSNNDIINKSIPEADSVTPIEIEETSDIELAVTSQPEQQPEPELPTEAETNLVIDKTQPEPEPEPEPEAPGKSELVAKPVVDLATTNTQPEAVPKLAPEEKPLKPKSKTGPVQAVKDNIELNTVDLSEKAQQIKRAFNEKQIIQTFQPVIYLISEEERHDVYLVSIQLIDTDGSIIYEDEIQRETNTPAFRKSIDR